MGSGNSTSRKGSSAICLAVIAALASIGEFACGQTSTWVGPAGADWNNPAAWSPNGVPNNGTNGVSDYDVIIGGPAPTNFNLDATIDDLTINTDGTLEILPGEDLNLNGSSLVDNGSIVLNYGSPSDGSAINFAQSTTLSGTGSITFNSPLGYDQLDSSLGNMLTVGPTNTIQGGGLISAALTNNGTIDANSTGQSLNLQAFNMTNNGTFEATGSGTLAIYNITVTQGPSGVITDGVAHSVVVSNANIVNGTLNGAGSFYFNGSGTITTITNDTTINVGSQAYLNVYGDVVDNGSIVVNPANQTEASILDINGGTVSGTGAIILIANGNAVLTGSLTQGAGHSIEGYGEVMVNLTNNGIVNANANGSNLTIVNPVTNNGVMEATGGGCLNLDGLFTINNSNGQINAAGGDILLQDGITINGGMLGGTSAESFILSNNNRTSGLAAVLSGGVSVCSGAVLNIQGSFDTVAITGATFTNNGTVIIGGDNSGLSFNSPSMLLTGTGKVVLNGQSPTLETGDGDSLTQDVNHSIEGAGDVVATLINNGVVNANLNGSGLALMYINVTNNGLFEATSGGILGLGGGIGINGITVTQSAAGLVYAGVNSAVYLNESTIVGGTLSSAPATTTGTAGFVTVVYGTGTLTNVTNDALVTVTAQHQLDITGALTDNGTILVTAGGLFPGSSVLNIAGVTVSGTGTFELISGYGPAEITGSLTQAAGHTIEGYGQINATVTNNGVINANAGDETLQITQPLNGSGTLEVSTSTAKLQIAPNVGLCQQGALSITPGGILDITNNELAINYGVGNPSPISTVVSEIQSGYNGGGWNGTGIISSTAASNTAYGIAYADGGIDSGTPAVPGEILIEYDLYGDANLDGVVNLTDLLMLLNNYSQSGADWSEGDFNYDGTVNLTDLLLLLNNYGESAGNASVNSTAVPESCLAGWTIASWALVRRKRNGKFA